MTLAASRNPAIVLLELDLPDIDGMKVIASLRGWTTLPIVAVTTRQDERFKVGALDAGADDYITKPFGTAELIARMRAILRRRVGDACEPAKVTTTAFSLDLTCHRAFTVSERAEVHLTAIEWGIVGHLVRCPRTLVTYQQIATSVWGSGPSPGGNLLRVHMGHIRRKLEPVPARPRFFMTNAGLGYRFEPDQHV